MQNKDFQSVFDDSEKMENQFDNVFGATEDDDLMNIVSGLNEDGVSLPDDEELHQIGDEATPKDLADELGEGHDTKNKPTCDSSEGIDLDDDDGINVACGKFGVQDNEPGVKVDPENIEDASDKAADKFEKTYNEADEDLVSELDDDDVEDIEESSDKNDDEDSTESEDLVSELDDDDVEESSTKNDEDETEPVEEDKDLVSELEDDDDDIEGVKEDANPSLPESADEDNIIDKVEKSENNDIPDSMINNLKDDEDEDLIDIVAGE